MFSPHLQLPHPPAHVHPCPTPNNGHVHLHLLTPLSGWKRPREMMQPRNSQFTQLTTHNSPALSDPHGLGHQLHLHDQQQHKMYRMGAQGCAHSHPQGCAHSHPHSHSHASPLFQLTTAPQAFPAQANQAKFHIDIVMRKPRSFTNGTPLVACGCRRSLTVRVSTEDRTLHKLDLRAHLSLDAVGGCGTDGVEVGVIQHRSHPNCKPPVSTADFPSFCVGEQIVIPLKFDPRIQKQCWEGAVDYRFCNVERQHGPYRWNAVIHEGGGCLATCSCSFQQFFVNKKGGKGKAKSTKQ